MQASLANKSVERDVDDTSPKASEPESQPRTADEAQLSSSADDEITEIRERAKTIKTACTKTISRLSTWTTGHGSNFDVQSSATRLRKLSLDVSAMNREVGDAMTADDLAGKSKQLDAWEKESQALIDRGETAMKDGEEPFSRFMTKQGPSVSDQQSKD